MTVKVFKLNDCEWWAGHDLDSVMNSYLEQTGLTADEAFEDPRELTTAEMECLLHWGDEETGLYDHPINFQEHLAVMVAQGDAFPCLFASTEY